MRPVRRRRVWSRSVSGAAGNFYDCDGHLLTGLGTKWEALCVPGEGNYTRLFSCTDAAGQALLYQKRNALAPFFLEVEQDVSALGIFCWPVSVRSPAAPLAEHLIGYVDGDSKGAAGLEAAFDAALSGTGEGDTLTCLVNAQGKLRETPEQTHADSGAVGVQLTLSRDVQRAAEAVAARMMTTGSIVVLETAGAEVRACVSVPGYDPADPAASLNAPDSPMLNRAFQSYAVGSVFKPVLAAVALEAGETGLVYHCPGWCEVDGQIFRCAGGAAHGEVDLAAALEKSCNGYFIRLGQTLGAERVRTLAEQLGFGRTVELTDSFRTAAGKLPELAALTSSGAYANFCFGQGELLATPVQIAGMLNALVTGMYREPLFLRNTLDETTGEPLTPLAHRRAERVVSEGTASALRMLLAGVVENGTGHEAALPETTAAGKTGTAQTGQFRDGVELKTIGLPGCFRQKNRSIPSWYCRTRRPSRPIPALPFLPHWQRCWKISAHEAQLFLLFAPLYAIISLYLYVVSMKLTIKGAFHPCLLLKSSAVSSCLPSRSLSSSSP